MGFIFILALFLSPASFPGAACLLKAEPVPALCWMGEDAQA